VVGILVILELFSLLTNEKKCLIYIYILNNEHEG